MKIKKIVCLLAVALVIPLTGFVFPSRSEIVVDKSAGTNGSFEVARRGFPVNWLFYAPRGRGSDFDILLDRSDPKEGKQSLKFVVRKCSRRGGRFSPGFTQQFPVVPGETYQVSYWIKNQGSDFAIRVGTVNAFEGDYPSLVRSAEKIESWRRFSTKLSVPTKMKALRFELSIRAPGTLWIDDLRIEETER